ncbi:MAG: hypothetical protein KJ000_14695 [Pirellulaceae bacterium]|nr:hypothetical protein [Pirellulaceae bacterium]
MKTTLDLPSDLVQEIKLRAANEGRTLKDVAADLLRSALAPSSKSNSLHASVVSKNLPMIKALSTPTQSTASLTDQEFCNCVKQAELDLEVDRYEEAFGHQHVDRTQH